MNEYIVNKQISIKATPEIVWEALTDPVKTKKYFFNCKVISDWQPGSPIIFKGRIFLFIKIEMHGKIIKAEPGKILQYTLQNNRGSDGRSTVTDTLHYENGVTTLTITDDVGKDEDAQDRYTRSVKGWDKILKGLKKMLEKK